MKNKLYNKVKDWYLDNKSSAIAKTIGGRRSKKGTEWFYLKTINGEEKPFVAKCELPFTGEVFYLQINEKHFRKIREINETIWRKEEIEYFDKKFNNRYYKVEEINSKCSFNGKKLEFVVSFVKAKEVLKN